MDKSRVVAALAAAVRTDLEALAHATADARDAATSGEARAENKYDTRATEASYLATGQGERLIALRALAEWLGQLDPEAAFDAVGKGALVALERDGEASWVLVGPQGGHSVTVDGRRVLLISGDSPLGQLLAGLQAGDAEELDSPRGVQELVVVEIR